MFIYKFNTVLNFYIYDVPTNNILKVNKIVWDIIDDVDLYTSAEIINKWKNKYSPEEIKKGLEEINKFKASHKLFTDIKELRLELPLDYYKLKDTLNSNLEQLILNVTESCNLNCEYCVYSGCYIYERSHSDKKMTFEIAKKALKFFFERNKKSEIIAVTFYGGEPLLNFNLIQKCISFIQNNFEKKITNKLIFAITTNGTLLNRKIIDFLVKHNFSILISLDGPQEIHDRYRRYKTGLGSFSKIMKNLEFFNKRYSEYFRSEKISFSVVLAPPIKTNLIFDYFATNELLKNHRCVITYPSLRDTTFFERFNMHKIREEFVDELKNLLKNYVELHVQNYTESPKLKLLRNLFDDKIIRIHRRQKGFLDECIYPNAICIPGKRRLFVSTSGKFFICEKMDESIQIGDVNRGFYYKKIKNLIEQYIELSEDLCRNCWAVRLCGECWLSAKKGKRLDKERKAINCEEVRKATALYLKIYCEIMERNTKALDYMDQMVIY